MEHTRAGGTASSWLAAAAIVVGYASFRAANSSIYLSRFAQSPESFIFMTDPAFNITSAMATVLCAGAVIALSAAGRLKDFSMPVTPAAVILLCGMGASVLEKGVPFPEGATLVFSVVAFAAGSIMLKMAWIEIFAHEAPRQAIIQIACAGLASAVLQYVPFLAGSHLSVLLTIALLALSTACLLFARHHVRHGERNKVQVREGVRDALCDRPRDVKRSWRAAFDEISDALLALCVLEAVIGLINSFMLAASMTFSGAASVPSVAMAIAAALFCFAALITRRLPAASATFRMAFPVVAAMVVFVPFASEGYSRLFSTVLLTGYDFVALLLLYQVAYASHKFGVSSYALMALFSGCTKLCLLAALVAGGIFGGQETEGAPSTVRFLVLSCAVIYLLAITLTLLSRDRRKRSQRRRERAELEHPHEHERGRAQKDALTEARAQKAAGETTGNHTDGADGIDGMNGANDANDADGEASRNAQDGRRPTRPGLVLHGEENGDNGRQPSGENEPFDAICRELSERYGLTGRETEILGHLARGRTNTRIAEDLVISPSTVRGHIRHIYTKLDVHDRQELIDLFH